MTMQTTNGAADHGAIIERVVALGDLEALKPIERAQYYTRVCESVGLNPLTQPFMYTRLQGKLQLYAKKDATDQLRMSHKVSIRIIARELDADGVYTVTARCRTPDGREDESTGSVFVGSKKGEDLANAKMKAETKAKRRATLSICGLGWLDETEVGDVRGARFVTVTEDGEIIDEKPASEPDLTKQLAASVNWDDWAAEHLMHIEAAETKGDLNIAWAAVNADKRKLNPPDLQYAALAKAKDARKVALS